MFWRRRGREAPDHPEDSQADPDPSAVVTVTAENFSHVTAGAFTIVDFWAPWCAPCRKFAPDFRAVAARYSDRVRFGSCNVDEYPEIAALLQIMSIPTLVLFDPDGNEAGRVVGSPGRQSFEEMVQRVAAHAEQHRRPRGRRARPERGL